MDWGIYSAGLFAQKHYELRALSCLFGYAVLVLKHAVLLVKSGSRAAVVQDTSKAT